MRTRPVMIFQLCGLVFVSCERMAVARSITQRTRSQWFRRTSGVPPEV